MRAAAVQEILDLSVQERLDLVQALWDSIAERPNELSLSEADRELLDRRLGAYRENPHLGSSWEEVVERIRSNAPARRKP